MVQHIPAHTSPHPLIWILLLLLSSGPIQPAGAQGDHQQAPSSHASWTLTSPNGSISVALLHDPGAAWPTATSLGYEVRLGDQVVLTVPRLGLELAAPQAGFLSDLSFVDAHDTLIDETYTLPAGKQRSYHNHARQKTLTFSNSAGELIEFVFRAYDDGVAFRYRFPTARNRTITGEATTLMPPSGARAWMQPYVSTYERFYGSGVIGSQFQHGQYGFPALYTTGAAWVLLTEAAVYGDHSGARLLGSGQPDGAFSIMYNDPELRSSIAWESPWRVAIVGNELDDLVRSTIVEHLNPPPSTDNLGWIVPGRVAWSWWSDPNSPESLEQQKAYVDFAHEIGWEYVLVDEGWHRSWIPALVDYAAERGVGVLLWTPWTELDSAAKRADKLPLWKSWGITGIKVDFLKSDRQELMRFYDAISHATLREQLLINFHGSTIPRGQRRRWPHILTYEAVRGAEYYSLPGPPTPAHNTILPFTRNIVGPMDYTPTTFSASARSTTDAHELALPIVFESGLQHLADTPATYRASPGYYLLRALPVRWDETRLIDGYPGAYAALARRSGARWFVGAINADTPRTLALPLDFLGYGMFTARIYRDGPGGGIVVERHYVAAGGTLRIDMPAGGGAAICLTPSLPAGPAPTTPFHLFLPLITSNTAPPC